MKGQIAEITRMVVSVSVTMMIILLALDLSSAVDDKIRMESLGMVEQRIEANTLMISSVDDGMVEMETKKPYRINASTQTLNYASNSSLIEITGITLSQKKLDFAERPAKIIGGKSDVFCIANSEAINPNFQIAATSCSELIG